MKILIFIKVTSFFFWISYAARILRGVRIAARLGFCLSRETAYSVKSLSYSVLKLDKVVSIYTMCNFFPLNLDMHEMLLDYSFTFANDVGKAFNGSELHVSIWFCWSFFEIVVEIWTSRNTFTYSGMYLILNFFSPVLIFGSTFEFSTFLLQAAYFVQTGFQRRDKRSNMLLVIIIT